MMKVIFKKLAGVTGRRFVLYMLLLGWFVASVPATAQTTKPQPQRVVEGQDDRSQRPRVRYPSEDRLSDYRDDRDYQYDSDPAPPDNPLARLWQWIWGKISDFLRSDSYQNVWQYVMLAVIAALVVYLLRKAEVLGFLFPGKAQATDLDYETLSENIHAINFDEAIDAAVAQRNFRLAVRLLYLKTLKQLTDQEWITYKPDKTNRQYVYELAGSPLQADFEALTQQFEYVWYGDFPVDEARYAQISSEFRQFFWAKQPVRD
ncbi:hypothetical protein BN8_05510 [Fibrisoma limi BUZ 3]|uniref:Protein-glutamine gamma-glutamyltransferase-like C-terminal domain-containing protein n=1 Tax=Fibrisoma limi BUZ 3 TaxID=1185876 RepID=I2GQL2_9BACT|nr:DUF4129 domain-containing protein [Fibrisoma limi]CCH56190.1 hypothetical protein BN8_05510 [Fibrisoma limi BUZ 3]